MGGALVVAGKLRDPFRTSSGGTPSDISWARSRLSCPQTGPPQVNSYI